MRLLFRLGSTFDDESYTVYAFLVEAGAPDRLAHGINLALGAAVLALAWRMRSFALAIGAALLLSPIVWLHFFALLALPLAAASPRFSWPWLLPIAMIVAPGTYNGDPWQSAVVLATAGAVVAYAFLAEQPGGAARSARQDVRTADTPRRRRGRRLA